MVIALTVVAVTPPMLPDPLKSARFVTPLPLVVATRVPES